MVHNPATGIIWLPSYPRSGNTWLRFLLTNLFYTDQATQQDADVFITDQVDQMMKPQDGNPGRDFSEVNPDNFLTLFNEDLDIVWGDKMMRTHCALPQVRGLMPQSLGFIYVIRHPLDVALSCLDYDLLYNPNLKPEQYRKDYIHRFIETRGASSMAAISYGINWVEHVDSWVNNQEDLPGILVRYEDMLADTATELRRICKFLDVAIDEEAIATSIHHSSFSQLRKIEEQAIAAGDRGSLNNPDQFKPRQQEGFRFVNRGKAGVYRSRLTPDERALAAKAFAPIAQTFGYTFD